jgi:hypothetical protein
MSLWSGISVGPAVPDLSAADSPGYSTRSWPGTGRAVRSLLSISSMVPLLDPLPGASIVVSAPNSILDRTSAIGANE